MDNKVSNNVPDVITEEYFREKVGRKPEEDDLERCNCVQAGMIGHYECGWCPKCDLPRFECGHILRTPTKKVYKTANRNMYKLKSFSNSTEV